MFIRNRYYDIYYSIILGSQSRVKPDIIEKHHIIPKSLGGTDDESNIALLTPKEHFICHKLLIKITEGEARRKMAYALWSMTRSSTKHSRKLNSTDYDYARKQFVKNHYMRNLTPEQRKLHSLKLSKSLKGKPKIWSDEARQKRSELYQSGKLRNQNSKYWLVTHPDGTKEKIDNMALFCRKHNLSKGNASNHGKTKGFIFEDLGR
jgi:hypothetical protein